MKSTKTILLAALAVGVLLAYNSSLLAQDSTNTPAAGQRPPGGRGMISIDRVATQLNLTDAEKTQVTPIIEDLNKKLTDLRADSSLSREDRTAKRKTIMEDTTAQLKPILTDDQLAQWEKMGQRTRRPAPPAGGDNAMPPASTPPAAPQN